MLEPFTKFAIDKKNKTRAFDRRIAPPSSFPSLWVRRRLISAPVHHPAAAFTVTSPGAPNPLLHSNTVEYGWTLRRPSALTRHRLGGGGRIQPPLGFSGITSSFITVYRHETWHTSPGINLASSRAKKIKIGRKFFAIGRILWRHFPRFWADKR